jgi:EAL domain-containing protein (putative c-di-GMP-specific phosphodiesterase class I)
MERRIHLYVSRRNVFVWLSLLAILASAVTRIVPACMYAGYTSQLWSELVLPVAAAVLFVAVVLIAGDEMLYLFSFSLDKLFTEGTPFHMYGTTFALVLPCDEGENPEQTEKLIEFLDTKIKYIDEEIKLDYILAELVWKDDANADTFYEKLEYATDIAKVQKLKYIKCSLELEIARLRKKYLINRLQNIDKESGYEIWFQPIYSVKKKAFSSMEVLLRLKEKNGGFISPAEFIPLAEQTGQITAITWFVIEETCHALANTPELARIRASINLPMMHLTDPDFEHRLNDIVDGYGISHDRISFEFTERVILDDLDLAQKNMKRLAESGYTFYIDDFGVGYSNFNCVLKLPLKTVKLDMSLTSTAEKLKENYGLVYILTDLFHDMGLNVVAEGAETAEQVELLKAYGVDGIQGYFYAKPMPLQKLCDFLTKNHEEVNG